MKLVQSPLLGRLTHAPSVRHARHAKLLRPTAVTLSNFPASGRRYLSPRVSIPYSALRFSSSVSSNNPTPGAPIGNVSTVIGPSTPPLDERTLSEFWSSMVEKYPTSPALISSWEKWDVHSHEFAGGAVEETGGKCIRWTFAEMDKEVDRLARGLLAMGLRKGDRVAVYLGNGSSYALLQWATAKLGLILACINPASRGPELLAALNLTTCKALFIPPSIKKNQLIPVLKTLLPSLVDSDLHELNEPLCPSLRSVVLVDNTILGTEGFRELLREQGVEKSVLDFRHLFVDGDGGIEGRESLTNSEVINLQFTSGTTGEPKAVSLTHRNLLNNGFYVGECMNLRPPSPQEGWEGERLCNSPPLFHCFGLVLGNLAFWTHGGCIVYPSETFNPAQTLRATVVEKCTALHGVPTMFVGELALLDHVEMGQKIPGLSDLKLDFSSLRTGIAAGSPVPDVTMRNMIKRLNLRDLVITYGQTETSPATVMSSTTDPVDLRCTTVGRAMPNTSIRIVDTSSKLYPSPSTPSAPLGVPGELWSAGYAVQKGYWANQPETDKAIFADETGLRWMRTGDEAIMDSEGYISIVGRIKAFAWGSQDIIVKGGENIFPVVVENRALLLPGVADCSVIAVPCPKFLETVGAFVQRDDSPAGRALTALQISMHIDKVLSHQSRPEWIWWLGEDGVPDEFPKTASGKIRKIELRDWAKKLQERGLGQVDLPGKSNVIC